MTSETGESLPLEARQLFLDAFEVVFVDPSGHVNLASRVSRTAMEEVHCMV